MSLKKKIALSFFISAFIIAILAAFEYINFVELRKQVRYLEVTDTINRKSLWEKRKKGECRRSGSRLIAECGSFDCRS